MYDGPIIIEKYRPGIVGFVARGIGRLIGYAIQFAPYLLAPILLLHLDLGANNFIWNGIIIFGGAAILFLLENRIVKRAKDLRYQVGGLPPMFFGLFILALFMLHIWVVQAGAFFLLQKFHDARILSWLFAFLLAVKIIFRLPQRRWEAFFPTISNN